MAESSRTWSVVALALLGWAVPVRSAADLAASHDTPAEPTVALPPFVVHGVAEGLPWMYARYRGFEVLTLCPPDLTRDYLEAMRRGRYLVPDLFQNPRTELTQAVLFNLGQPQAAPAVIKIGSSARRFGAGWMHYQGGLSYGETEDDLYAANLTGLDRFPTLDTEYLWRLFTDYRPKPPEWLMQGLFGDGGALSSLGGYGKDEARLRLSVFEWLDEIETRNFIHERNRDPGFLPMEALFAAPPDSSPDPQLRRKWARQVELFVRWQLFGKNGTRHNDSTGFWRLAYVACTGAIIDETVFKECLGWNYAEATERMRKYLGEAVLGPADIGFKTFPKPGVIELRMATEAEVARLKGNFERMEAKRLRADHPDLAGQYEAAARRTLKRGLRLTDNDPGVRAVFGLLESDTGHPAEARSHLEAAFAAKATGTRALLALARLRLDEAGGTGERLTVAQLESTFAPLSAARERTPALIETYRLVGEVWSRSAAAPRREHLAVLLEGVKHFPHDLGLLLQAAELHQRYGFDAEALALARLGMQRAGTSEQRQPFTQLLAHADGGTPTSTP